MTGDSSYDYEDRRSFQLRKELHEAKFRSACELVVLRTTDSVRLGR